MIDRRKLDVYKRFGQFGKIKPVDLSEDNLDLEKAGRMVYDSMWCLTNFKDIELSEEEVDKLAGIFSALGFVSYVKVSKDIYNAKDIPVYGEKQNLFQFPLSVYVHLISDDPRSVNEYIQTITGGGKHGKSWCNEWCEAVEKDYWNNLCKQAMEKE